MPYDPVPDPLVPPIQVPDDAVVVPYAAAQGVFDIAGKRLYETAFALFARNLVQAKLPEAHLLTDRRTAIDRYGAQCTWCELVRPIVAWDLDLNLATLCKVIILIEPRHGSDAVIDAITSDSVDTAGRLWRAMCA